MRKNIRKIPLLLAERIGQFDNPNLIVSCAAKIPISDLEAGRYKHLGLTAQNLNPGPVIPPKSSGKHSRWNVDGRVIIRKDLPKEPFSYDVEAPDFRGPGTHTVTFYRERYPRQHIAPEVDPIL